VPTPGPSRAGPDGPTRDGDRDSRPAGGPSPARAGPAAAAALTGTLSNSDAVRCRPDFLLCPPSSCPPSPFRRAAAAIMIEARGKTMISRWRPGGLGPAAPARRHGQIFLNMGTARICKFLSILLVFVSRTNSSKVNELKQLLTARDLRTLRGDSELRGWLEACNGNVAEVPSSAVNYLHV
jgi:hypothetical protein